MYDSIVAHRADDAVISVQQDNVTQTLVITGMNDRALRLLGFDSSIPLRAPLSSILDVKTKDTIGSYLEYSDSGTDLADVVSKIRDFTLINVKSEAVPVSTKIFRTASKKNCLNYEILIRDTSVSQKLDAYRRKKLPSGSSYTIDKHLGILDEASTRTELGVICDFANTMQVDAILSVIGMDQPISCGERALNDERKSLVDALSTNLRYSDIVGYLGGNEFVFVLLGCSFENALSAVSRIHGRVAEKLSRLLPYVSASCVYTGLQGTVNSELLVDELSKALSSSQKSGSSFVSAIHVDAQP